MSDTNPDPKMMRHQQDKDAPETIEADETQGVRDRSDSDPLSKAAREAAQGEVLADPAKGQDDVLAANDKLAGASREESVRRGQAGPLAGKDRSLLGK